MVRKFKGHRYQRDILLDPGEYDEIHLGADIDSVLEISAWEDDGEQFDLYLLRRDDVLPESFRTARALKAKEATDDVKVKQSFDEAGNYCVILSNLRATGRDKLIHVRLTWLQRSEGESGEARRDAEPHEEAQQKAQLREEVKPDTWPHQQLTRARTIPLGLAGLVLVVIMIILGASGAYLFTRDPAVVGISSIAMAGLGLILTYLRESRKTRTQ